MNHHALASALLLMTLSWCGAGPDEAIPKDLQTLQGSWVLDEMEVDGIKVEPAKLKGTTVTITGDSYVSVAGKRKQEVTLRLDPTQDPKHLDMIFRSGPNKDKVHRGIYRILPDGRFQISRGLNPEQERPREFATWPGTSCFVATWRRGSGVVSK